MFAQILKIKKKNGKTFEYLRIVRAVRKNGIPRHEVIANLGEVSQVKLLVPNILRKLGIGFPEAAVEPDDSYIWGPALVAREFFSRLGIDKAIRSAVKAPGHGIGSIDEFIDRVFALVAARLIEPTSEHGLARVLEMSYIPRSDKTRFAPHWRDDGITDKNSPNRVKVEMKELMKWYRTLDALIEHKEAFETNIFKFKRDLFTNSLDLVLYDITSSYFEGKGPATIAKRGYSRDGKSRNTQIVLGLLMMNGLPVAHHVFPGNTADKTTVVTVAEDLKKRFGVNGVTFVFDSGMISKRNLEKIEEEGYSCIVSSARRNDASVKLALKQLEKGVPVWRDVGEGTRVCEVKLPGRRAKTKWRYFVVESEERKKYERAIREGCTAEGGKLLADLAQRVKSGNLKDGKKIAFYAGKISLKQHINRYYSWEIDDGKFEYYLDGEKNDFEKSIEGRYFLRTNNSEIDPREVVRSYKGLAEIESAFREIKDTCHIRPIFHQKEERVKAHVFVAVLSYLIEKAVQQKLRAGGIALNPAQMFDRLRQIKIVNLKINGKEMFVPNKMSNACSRLLNAMNIHKISL